MMDRMQEMADAILGQAELPEVEERLLFIQMCEDMTEREVVAWNKEREPFFLAWSLKRMGQSFGIGDKGMALIGKMSQGMLKADRKKK